MEPRSLILFIVRSFQRVVPPPEPPTPSSIGMDGQMDHNGETCFVCGRIHPIGSCPLKVAGVEHCGLCGLAHFGHSRTCPHLRSDIQVTRMLEALKQSTEDRNLVALAKKYCYGIKGDLAQRKRRVSGKAAGSPANSTTAAPTAPTQPPAFQGVGIPAAKQPTIDLTGRPMNGHVNGTHPPAGPGNSHTDDVEMYSALSNYLSQRKQ